jgi:hypothetical protein
MNKMEHQITTVDNLIVSHMAGSHSYGTSLPTSDIDVRGIFCAEAMNIRTPWFPYREQNITSMEDAKVYEVTNFMNLYLDGNPNILETLWVDDEAIIQSSQAYDYLRLYRHDLLSKKVAFTFSGYALSQLKRIKGHNKWINNPQPEEPPKTGQFVKMVQNFSSDKIFPNRFDLSEWNEDYMLVPYGSDIYGVIYSSDKNTLDKGNIKKYPWDEIPDRDKKKPPMFIIKVCMDEYRLAKDNHKNYWKWKKERNVKRSELEEKFGYDTKHAMHLVRLLRMGEETLMTGEVVVRRPDAQELLDIRDGAFSYNELIKWAEDKDTYIRNILYNKSSLPKKPNVKLAAEVLMEVQDRYWSK